MKASDMKNTLALVRPGLAKKEILDQATSVIFKGGKVFTFNDEVSVIANMDIGVEGAIVAEPLYSFLSKLDGDAEVSIECRDNEFRFSSGRRRAGIRMEEEIKLPLEEEIADPDEWFDIPDNFVQSLEACFFSSGKDFSKPILTCIHITDEYIEACDGHRLMRAQVRIDLGEGPLDINVVSRNLEKLGNYNPKEVGFSKNWIHFRGNGVTYCARLVDGDYPDISEFMKVEGSEIIFPDNIGAAIDWASVSTDDVKKWDQKIVVELTKGKMTVGGEGRDGWGREEIRMKYTGTPVKFESHPAVLKEMANLAKSIIVSETALKIEGEKFVHVVSLE